MKALCSFLCLYLSIQVGELSVVDIKTVTWNMQGANDGSFSKYYLVENLLKSGVQIVALQEAGSCSYMNGTYQEEKLQRVLNPDRVFYHYLKRYKFPVGRNNAGNIYFLCTDIKGNRVNLAIATLKPADEVIILQRHDFHQSDRPLLGVRFKNDYFFDIHANAGNQGGNAAGLVNRTYVFMEQVRRHSWMIMGDFNRSPYNLSNAINKTYPLISRYVRTVSSGLFTQRGGNELDYAIEPTILSEDHEALRYGIDYLRYSDHIPVMFKRIHK